MLLVEVLIQSKCMCYSCVHVKNFMWSESLYWERLEPFTSIYKNNELKK